MSAPSLPPLTFTNSPLSSALPSPTNNGKQEGNLARAGSISTSLHKHLQSLQEESHEQTIPHSVQGSTNLLVEPGIKAGSDELDGQAKDEQAAKDEQTVKDEQTAKAEVVNTPIDNTCKQTTSADPTPVNTTTNTVADSSATTSESAAVAAAQKKRAAEDFDFKYVLGEGSYSTVVYSIEKATGRAYAAKILDKKHIVKEKKVKYVNIEKSVLSVTRHPFIIRLYYTFQDTQSLYFVTELAERGELLSYIRKYQSFDQTTSRFYAAEIVVAIEYLHRKGILHRDLKPENILLDQNMHIKLADFGTAKILQPQQNIRPPNTKPVDTNGEGSSSNISPETSSTITDTKHSLIHSSPSLAPTPLLLTSLNDTNKSTTTLHSAKIITNSSYDLNQSTSSAHHTELSSYSSSDQLKADSTKNTTTNSGSAGGHSKSFVGTAEYVAPELLQDRPVTQASDIWAIGCILYQLLAGRPPFKGSNDYQTFQRIIRLEYTFPDAFPELAKDLVSRILVSIPENRITLADIKLHPFFTSVSFDWNELWLQTPPKITPFLPQTDSSEELRSETVGIIGGGSPASLEYDPFLPMLNNNQHPSNQISASNTTFTSPESAASSRNTSTDNQISSTTRTAQLTQQQLLKWAQFLTPNELILYMGAIYKRKGLFAKKRFLILTDYPRLVYIDEEKMEVKGEIPWSKRLISEFKNKRNFFIHTPGRTYYLECAGNDESEEWVSKLNEVRKRVIAGEFPHLTTSTQSFSVSPQMLANSGSEMLDSSSFA